MDGTNEETQMVIAQAIEERNCLQAEIDLASRRCRQHVYAAHGCALLADRLAVRQDAVSKHVVLTVESIVNKASPPGRHSPKTPGKFVALKLRLLLIKILQASARYQALAILLFCWLHE